MNEQLQAIQKSIAFIEAHLRSEVTIGDIAAAAGYSLYHFIRTFNQCVHHTPYDYLLRRRLSQAALELLGSHRSILEIALDYQFNNPETFSRAFRRMFGQQASQWRRHGELDRRFLLPALTPAYLKTINQSGFSPPTMVERPETVLVGLMSGGQHARYELWQAVARLSRQLAADESQLDFYGVSSQPLAPEGRSFYLAGVAGLPAGRPDPPLVVQVLPAGPYACLMDTGSAAKRSWALAYAYHTWLPKSDFNPAFQVEIEAYGGQIPMDENRQSGGRMYIPLEAVSA